MDTSGPGTRDTAPAAHYDHVTRAWRLLLGDELHYGVFATGDEDLPTATRALTERMAAGARLEAGQQVLDVGCGLGEPGRYIASRYGVEVLGITTSAVGVQDATGLTAEAGLSDRVRFEVRDGTANGLPDASFDRVWVLESSHLMPDRAALIAECARVLRPGGRVVLCDLVMHRKIPFLEVRERRAEFATLRQAFGAARMDSLDQYAALFAAHGITVDVREDLTEATRPTFDAWRANATAHREAVLATLHEDDVTAFQRSTEILASLWDDGTMGYGLLAGHR